MSYHCVNPLWLCLPLFLFIFIYLFKSASQMKVQWHLSKSLEHSRLLVAVVQVSNLLLQIKHQTFSGRRHESLSTNKKRWYKPVYSVYLILTNYVAMVHCLCREAQSEISLTMSWPFKKSGQRLLHRLCRIPRKNRYSFASGVRVTFQINVLSYGLCCQIKLFYFSNFTDD